MVAEGLSKRFGRVHAAARHRPGTARWRRAGAARPYGAGKTTVRILSTLLHPDGGRAHVAGFAEAPTWIGGLLAAGLPVAVLRYRHATAT
jgi:ABC-type branched-subunit amino acid transport system ATPase component